MAVYIQQYNPWREQLAVNVLGGLLNDWRQREANKKANAFSGQLGQDIAALRGGQQGSFLMQQPAPEGYNADGWSRAFHQTGSPLTQFDIGTAGAMPKQNTPAEQNLLNASDIYNLASNLRSSKRFSGMTPQTLNELITPYIQMNEQTRQEQRRKDLVNAYMNAGDAKGKLDQLIGGALQGDVPQWVLSSGQDRYKYDNPYWQMYSHNSGPSTSYEAFNPLTGEGKTIAEFVNGMTPAQEAANNLNLRQLGVQTAQNNAELQLRREQMASENAYRNAVLQQNSQRKLAHIVRGDDGLQYKIYSDGSKEALNPGSVALTQMDTQRITFLENKRKNLTDRLNGLMKARSEEQKNISGGVAGVYNESDLDGQSHTSARLEAIDMEIAQTQGEIQQTDNDINGIYEGRIRQSQPVQSQSQPVSGSSGIRVGQGMDIGANMISHTNNGAITTHFGASRTKKDGTKYGHAGTDYPSPKGTPILLDDVGTLMTVTKVTNDPDGYGNYVDLEGVLTDENGKQHKIGMRFAHMGNGTVKVARGQQLKFGDQIGAVGNTGNSRGKNGGYHLHLETTIDGVRKDPTKFKELISPYIQHTKTLKPAQKNVPVSSGNDEIVYTHSNGKTITRKRYNELIKGAEAGTLSSGARTKAEVDAALKEAGYSTASRSDIRPVSPNVISLGSQDVNPISQDMTQMNSDIHASIDQLDGENNASWGIYQRPYDFGTPFDEYLNRRNSVWQI